MGLCSGGRISRSPAYMEVSIPLLDWSTIPQSRPVFRKTSRQSAIESLPWTWSGDGRRPLRAGATRSVIEG
jgi:hypothetical protein